MIRQILAILALTTISGTAMAQDVRPHIDKAIKDPQRNENAAKADQLIHNKQVITDTTTTKRQTVQAVKKKKKGCGSRTKRSE